MKTKEYELGELLSYEQPTPYIVESTKYSNTYKTPLIAGTDTHALNLNHVKGRHILQISKGVKFAGEENWDLTFKSYEELVKAGYDKYYTKKHKEL